MLREKADLPIQDWGYEGLDINAMSAKRHGEQHFLLGVRVLL
jgi:hypothetical protein